MRRLIVAITGASGVIYGIRTLEVLRDIGDIETHLILTPSGARTLIEETDLHGRARAQACRSTIQLQRHRRIDLERIV
jgi:4-hydroxy-3-polyprenylbenzoate decarboxylase